MIGAIDIGSNGMRLGVGRPEGHSIELLYAERAPVRLGADVFTSGLISDALTLRAIEALATFRDVFRRFQVTRQRVVATSALREAKNRDVFVQRIYRETGLRIEVISGEEEARLIHAAVTSHMRLGRRVAMLIDIGGGSAEVTVAAGARILAAQTFAMGAVRLRELLHAHKGRRGENAFLALVREYASASNARLHAEIGRRRIGTCVATGGNMECLRDLRSRILGKRDRSTLSLAELDALIAELSRWSVMERRRRFGLRPDRADVVVPAAVVLRTVMAEAHVSACEIPRVGVREGVLLALAGQRASRLTTLDRGQVLASAREIALRYRADMNHANTVAVLAGQLFSATSSMHGFGVEEQIMLEAASILHDIGHAVSASGHHKHSWYLIMASPFVGLDDRQRAIVAATARFHRKAMPRAGHEALRNLRAHDRTTAIRLAALLRIADSIDYEHVSRVRALRCTRRGERVTIAMHGSGPLLLERWSVTRGAAMFEHLFRCKIRVI
jgi:exopolyphosphatase/guanosine-5'-triphosphate,3'-diphosphate pyrophosphatase